MSGEHLKRGKNENRNAIRAALGRPTPDRILKVAQALRTGTSKEDVYNACKIDPWFLSRIQELIDQEARVRAHGLPGDAWNMRKLKAAGFSDERLATLTGQSEQEVRAKRAALETSRSTGAPRASAPATASGASFLASCFGAASDSPRSSSAAETRSCSNSNASSPACQI